MMDENENVNGNDNGNDNDNENVNLFFIGYWLTFIGYCYRVECRGDSTLYTGGGYFVVSLKVTTRLNSMSSKRVSVAPKPWAVRRFASIL